MQLLAPEETFWRQLASVGKRWKNEVEINTCEDVGSGSPCLKWHGLFTFNYPNILYLILNMEILFRARDRSVAHDVTRYIYIIIIYTYIFNYRYERKYRHDKRISGSRSCGRTTWLSKKNPQFTEWLLFDMYVSLLDWIYFFLLSIVEICDFWLLTEIMLIMLVHDTGPHPKLRSRSPWPQILSFLTKCTLIIVNNVM